VRGPVTAFLALAISFGAWGSLAPAPQAGLPDVASPAPEPLGPTALEWLVDYLGHFQMRLSASERRSVAETLIAECQRYDLDRNLVLAVIRIESGFNAFARSHMGALGLMQVIPETGESVARDLGLHWRGPETLLDPVANVKIGTAYLAWLHGRYGEMDHALAAYNWGPAAIDRRLRRGRPMPARYVTQVRTAFQARVRR